MKNDRSRFPCPAILCLLLPFVLVPTANAQTKFKVGAILPLSGDVANWGADARNALEFAGKKLGGDKFEIIYEDDKCRGKDAVTAAQKLISVDKVDFGIVACSESVLSAAPIFEKAKVVLITPIGTAAAISDSGDYVFRTWPSDAMAAEKLTRHIKVRHKNCGVLTENRGYSAEFAKSLLERLASAGVKTTNEKFESSDTDYRPQLMRLRRVGAESLVLNTNSESALLNILRNMKQLQWEPSKYGLFIPGNHSFLQTAGGLANGIVFADSPSPAAVFTEEGRSLFSEFVSLYGKPAANDFIFATTFEAVRLMAGANGGRDIRSHLYEGSFSGLYGEYRFDKNGDIVGPSHSLKVIKDGKPEELSF